MSKTPEGALAFLKDAGSDQMQFRVHRSPKPNTTFSREAMEELTNAVSTFIGARLLDHWKEAGQSDLVVDVRVTIDGETFTVPADLVPFFEIDGALRN